MPKGVICGGAVDGSNQLGDIVHVPRYGDPPRRYRASGDSRHRAQNEHRDGKRTHECQT
jgi:hypothetical protein